MDKSKAVHAVQMNLFLPRPTLPRWTQLPTEVQETTRELVVQILCEYLTEQTSESSEKEVGNE